MSAYNLESIRELAGGDEDFLKVLVETFLEEIPPEVAAMQKEIANGNAELSYQYAHKMKPNLQMFGLNLLEEIKDIEAWSKGSKTKSEIENSITKIINTVSKASEELKTDFNL